jgi:hypothetical protein
MPPETVGEKPSAVIASWPALMQKSCALHCCGVMVNVPASPRSAAAMVGKAVVAVTATTQASADRKIFGIGFFLQARF